MVKALAQIGSGTAPSTPAPKYTDKQIDIALGIMSGRWDPERHLVGFSEAKLLHPEIVAAINGGTGNPGPHAHRVKAEEILLWLIRGGTKGS